jgi:hypothetical protein
MGTIHTHQKANQDSPLEPARNISQSTTILLYTRAGGCCEFDGCGDYLLEHQLTETSGNFGERAHIYGFKQTAARASEPGRPEPADINQIDNLILLCPTCHHLVDNVNPTDYPVSVLKRFKVAHESRMRTLHDLPSHRRALPVVLKGVVAGRAFELTPDEMQTAAAPYWLKQQACCDIDLTMLPDTPDEHFWAAGKSIIDDQINGLEQTLKLATEPHRICVFGLAPIPLIAYLGSKISDKHDVVVYPVRRPRSLNWGEGPGISEFEVSCIQVGRDNLVALLVNLSGQNDISHMPKGLAAATVYEITTSNKLPSPNCIETEAELHRFSSTYLQALVTIGDRHPNIEHLHILPAIPTTAAFTLGNARLPKVHPPLLIYDRDQRAADMKPLEIK